MARTDVEHQQRPHHEWRRLLLAAWERLGEVKGARGIKTEILEAAGLGRTTLSRMNLTPELVSFDSWEDLRLALLDAYRDDPRLKDEAIPDLPKAFVHVRSTAHYELAERAGLIAEQHPLDDLVQWFELGERLSTVGIFPELLEAVKARVEAEEANVASREKLSAALRGGQSDADHTAMASAAAKLAKELKEEEIDVFGYDPDDPPSNRQAAVPTAQTPKPATKKLRHP